MDQVVCLSSRIATEALKKYCGGFMHVFDIEGDKFWAKLLRVDEERGIFVEAYHQQSKASIVRTKIAQGINFSVNGIMMFDRGGPFEMFGIIAEDEEGNLQQAYIPFDRYGVNIEGAKELVNIFYLPESKSIPANITQLFKDY